MSIPEWLFGDETASDIRTSMGRQPVVQEPRPVEPVMGPPQWRDTSMGYAQPASGPMGGFAYSRTWGTRGPPPGPIPQLDMESASNAGRRVSGQVAAIERIQGENTDPLTVRQQEKLLERRVSPAVSEQSRTSSRRLPTPPLQSFNLPLPRRGNSLSSLLISPAMNAPNWERTHTIHHSRTKLEIDLPEKAQQWLMTPANRSDFLWLYNVLLDPERILELLEAHYGQSFRNSRGILPLLPHTHRREKEFCGEGTMYLVPSI
ncbi:hypothetical protein F5877DRAFT_79389 [Lentinula edodes]|nr:hypothetical protein F5877DRAFT_79389 [Lentinula edodes]